MRQSKILLGAITAFTLVAVQACSSGGSSGGGSGSASHSTGGAIDTSATLTIQGLAGPSTFDPIKQTHSAIAAALLSPVYDTLVTMGTNLAVLGQLATNFSVADDGMSATATIRSGVTFWDGTPLDAAAIKANFDRVKSSASLISSFLANLGSTTAVSSTQLKFTFTAPTFNFFETLASNPALDMVVNPADFTNPQLATKGFGSGAYKVSSVNGTSAVTYERVGEAGAYWDKKAGQYKTLVFQFVPDDNARLNALKSGQASMIFASAGQAPQVKSLSSAQTFQEVDIPISAQIVMYLNTDSPALSDSRVRQAISLATDRAGVAAAENGICEPSTSLWPKGVEGYSDQYTSASATATNLDKAKQLLADAGHPTLSLNMIIPNASFYTTAVQVLQQTFKQVGITVKPTIVPPSDAPTQFHAGRFDIYFTQAGASIDPVSLMNITTVGKSSANLGDVPDYLTGPIAYAEQQKLGTDSSKAAWATVNKTMVDQPANAIAICQPTNLQVAANNVANVQSMGYAPLGGVQDARYLAVTK